MDLGEIRSLPVNLFRLAIGVDELGEAACDARAYRTAVGDKQDEFLVRASQHAAELQRSPGDLQDGRSMQRGIDLHEGDETLRLNTDIGELLVGIEKQFHVQRACVA